MLNYFQTRLITNKRLRTTNYPTNSSKAKLVLLLSGLLISPTPMLAAVSSPQAHNEHLAVMNLVPITSSTRQVVKSGTWSNPATWSGGEVPKANEDIYVPESKSLLVDINSETNIRTVRVDGAIKFATNHNVKLKLDTLVVAPSGSFEIGSEANRLPANRKVEIVIANNGPIDRKWDPANLSRGVILQGKIRIFGTEKSAFHSLAVNPALNATQLTLSTTPTGWAVGDLIAVTAVKFRYKHSKDTSHQTFDELRRIQAISGNSVTLGKVDNVKIAAPLNYSHIPSITNMPVYVANLTRNIIFSGEGEKSVPASQRGHFVVMHTPNAVIKGAGFYYLGRTNKAKAIDDFKLDSHGNRLKDSSGKFIPDANNNPRGRYSVHFHHTGVDEINTAPVVCEGNAIISSPGWGFVNHTSNVLIENNASYDVYGSHYVSEDGNELGAFKHNIAIKSEGRSTYLKFGQGNHDVGHTGHGFWLESRNLVMEDNVVSGVNKAGLVYWHRNEIPGVNLKIPVANLLTPDKELTKNMPSIFYERIPITHEKNTTVLASGGGLNIIKAFHKQDHDVRNVIDSFKAYSVLDGLELQYTEKYTLKNVEMIADPSTASWNKGVTLVSKVNDITLTNLDIKGFQHPIVTTTTFQFTSDGSELNFVDAKVNDRSMTGNDIHKPSKTAVNNFNPTLHHIIFTGDTDPSLPEVSLQIDPPTFTPSPDKAYLFPLGYNLGYIVTGTKTDSLGPIRYESRWFFDQLEQAAKKGYYTDSTNNKYIVLTDLISDRVTDKTRLIKTPLKLTNSPKGLGPYLGNLKDL
jgi:G8 domain